MAHANAIISNFTGGELSPRLEGRVDIKKYANGLKVCENFTIVPHGGARKRSGTRYVITQKDTSAVVFQPFQYNTEQSYMLLFGPGYVWFFKDKGIITNTETSITLATNSNPCEITSPAHGLATGNRVVLLGISGMTELNNRQFTITVIDANRFTISDPFSGAVDASSYGVYTSGGTVERIVELTTTYTEDELDELQFAQSADTLYISHRNHKLAKLQRSSHTVWTLSNVAINTGPFRPINGNRNITLTPSAWSASSTGYGTFPVGTTFTLTSSQPLFDPLHIGSIWRLSEEGGDTGITSAPIGDSTVTIANDEVYTNNGKVYGVDNVTDLTTWEPVTRVPAHTSGTVRVTATKDSGATGYFDSDFLHPGYCIIEILTYTSSTVVTASIIRYQMPESINTSGTTFWEEGAWSDYRGYPHGICFYEQRLMLAGSVSDPTVIWGSTAGAYEDFSDGANDADALVYRAAAGASDVIRWLSAGRVLTAGSSQGEYAIAASNRNEALTPSNVKATLQTTYGTSKCTPIKINQAVIYPQRNGKLTNDARKIREFAYSFQADAFDSTDLTVFSEHVTGAGIIRLAYQTEPDSLIWAVRSDGQLIGATYERAQEVVAWHRHIIGGTDTEVEMVGVIPGDDGDEVWLSVTRTVDGTTVRTVEVLLPAFNETTGEKEDGVFVDSSLTYEGSSTTTISGLYHLRNESVVVLNNGAKETHTISASGLLTLDRATTKCHVGYRIASVLETEDLEAGAQQGTAQSRMKRISKVFVRFLKSLGGTVGPDSDTQELIKSRLVSDPTGASSPLFSDFREVPFPSGFDRQARIRIEHDEPFPCFVGGIVSEISTAG